MLVARALRTQAGWLLLVCLLSACAVDRSSNKVHAVTELPPRYREVWVAWIERDTSWSERRATIREDPALAGFLADNLMRHMLQNYGAGQMANIGDDRTGPFDRSRAELLRFPAQALPRLTELLAIGGGHASELAATMLREIGRDAVLPVAALLGREDAQARRRAADLLGRLPHAHAAEAEVQSLLIKALADDSEWLVRAKAALAVGARGGRDTTTKKARAALSRALGDSDRSVGVRAVRGLSMLQDEAAVPAIINYMERSSRAGVVAGVYEAQAALRVLTHEAEQHDAAGWREYWREYLRGGGAAGR